MKIVDIDRFPIGLRPVRSRHETADPLSEVRCIETIVIRIRTDSRVVGYGETSSVVSAPNQSMKDVLEWLTAYATALLGADAVDLIEINRRLEKIVGNFPHSCPAARAAIEMAIYDIIGKVREVPVYAVLGGAYRTEMEMSASLDEATPQANAAEARRLVDEGFRGLKLKIGDDAILDGRRIENFERDKQNLLAVLEAVGSDISVDADACQSWVNAGQVRSNFTALLDSKFYRNLSLEQPLHHLDFKGHAELRRSLPIPVVLDESVVSGQAMMQIVRMAAADRIVIRVCRVGGFRAARQIADICEASAIGVSLDGMPCTALGDAALCHMAATVRDPLPVNLGSQIRMDPTPFTGGFDIADGRVILSKEPGLGVELDEEILSTLAVGATFK